MPTKRKTTIGGQPAAITQLRELIIAKGIPITELAEVSGVRYVPLWKFAKGRQRSYNLLEAELVFYALTGRTFLSAIKPTKH